MHLPVPPYMLLYYTLMNCNAHDMRVGLDGRSSTTSNPTDRHVGFGDPHFQANPVPSPHDIGGFQGALLLSRILTLLDQTNKYQRPLIPQTTVGRSLLQPHHQKPCVRNSRATSQPTVTTMGASQFSGESYSRDCPCCSGDKGMRRVAYGMSRPTA